MHCGRCQGVLEFWYFVNSIWMVGALAWWLILCIHLTEHKVTRYSAYVIPGVPLGEHFGVRLTFKLVVCIVVGLIPLVEGLNKTKKADLPLREREFFLPGCFPTGTSAFSCLWTETARLSWVLSLLAFGLVLLSGSSFSGLLTPGSPARQPTMQILYLPVSPVVWADLLQ